MKGRARLPSRWARVSRMLAIAGLLLPLSIGLFYLMGGRFNLTESLPLGVYWVEHQAIERGSYVRFCPPAEGPYAMARERGYLDAGFCSSGYIPMMKRIGGMQGDSVTVRDDGTWINDRLLPFSARRQADPKGRPLPKPEQSHYLLQSSQLWVISDTNEHSFDSRYFGPIDRKWVVEVIRPVLTWGYGGTLSQWRFRPFQSWVKTPSDDQEHALQAPQALVTMTSTPAHTETTATGNN